MKRPLSSDPSSSRPSSSGLSTDEKVLTWIATAVLIGGIVATITATVAGG